PAGPAPAPVRVGPAAGEQARRAAERAEEIAGVIQAGLLLLVVLFSATGFLTWWRYHHSRHEAYRYDFRALAEGLRVQVYWAAAGGSGCWSGGTGRCRTGASDRGRRSCSATRG